MATTVERALYDYVDYLNDLAEKQGDNRNYSVQNGKTYYKVVQGFPSLNGPHVTYSVHSFVSKDYGYLYKPAGWHRPVKAPKYNLVEQLDIVKQVADLYGSYLYHSFNPADHPVTA